MLSPPFVVPVLGETETTVGGGSVESTLIVTETLLPPNRRHEADKSKLELVYILGHRKLHQGISRLYIYVET